MLLPTRLAEHREQLFLRARHLTRGDASLAQDLVQDTFLRALEHAQAFEGNNGQLMCWLYTILRNCYYDNCRRRRKHARAVQRMEPLTGTTVCNNGEAEIRFIEVMRRLRIIPEDQRRALFAIAIAEVSYATAAGVEGVPEGTIKSRVHRARLALLD